MPQHSLKLAVLVSGSGRSLQNLIDLSRAGQLPADVRVVIASKPGIKSIDRAGAAGIRCEVIERKSFADIAAFSARVFAVCDEANADLVCLAGWLSLLGLPDRYRGRVMNIHPALLPSFGGRGMWGHHVHEAVLAHGCKISGCTVHFVDDAYDNGPIVLQRACQVLDDDTADTLADRVFEQELVAYPQAIRLFAEGRLAVEGRRVVTRAVTSA